MKKTEQLESVFSDQNWEFKKTLEHATTKSTNESQINQHVSQGNQPTSQGNQHSSQGNQHIHQHIQTINKNDVRPNSSVQNNLFSTFNSKVENGNLKK